MIGKWTDLTEQDIARRNTIANLLEQWGLVKLVDPHKTAVPTIPFHKLKIIKYGDKANWTLATKYNIGNTSK